jgi:hypothetical protein
MSVHYNCTTGRPAEVISTIRRRVSAFTRSGKVTRFKIGISNNPDRRWNESYKYAYDEMLVVYSSSSINNVSAVEIELVNHNWECCDNMIAGGGGSIARSGPYYLYVVVKY